MKKISIIKREDKIEIIRYDKDGHPVWLAYTDFREDIYKYIKDKTFYLNKGYPYSSSLKKSLHRIVMDFWYGEETCKEFRKNKFVIDHIENNAFNVQISNLHFISTNLNVSKGNDYDIEVKKALNLAGVTIYKNFNTNNYQITIGFSQPTNLYVDSIETPIVGIYLQYDDDFRKAMYEANLFINEINKGTEKISFSKFRFRKLYYRKAELITVQEGEEKNIFFKRDGQLLIPQGHPSIRLVSIPPKFEIDE